MVTELIEASTSPGRVNHSVRCNGALIASLRKKLGWTQSEFARKTGYSERLVRKAEASGKVMSVVMSDLTKALNSSGIAVSVEQLTSDPEQVARSLLASLRRHGGDWVFHAGDLMTDDVALRCAGDPCSFPFAGLWCGKEKVAIWAQKFHDSLRISRDDTSARQFLTSGDQVIVWGVQFWDATLSQRCEVGTSLRMQFVRGKLFHTEILFDTDRVRSLLTKESGCLGRNGTLV